MQSSGRCRRRYGALLRELLLCRLDLRGVLCDRPEVVADALEVFGETRARCDVVAGDCVIRVPGGGDVYVVKQCGASKP
jgi:hypothetical protein